MLEVFVVKIDAILERQKDIRTTAFKTTRGIKSSNCNSIIRIYGRNKRRESIQVLVHNYCPYFYLLVPLDDESKIDEQFCNVTFRHALTSILLNDIRISNWRLSVMQNKPLNDVVIRRAKNCYGYHSESSVFLEIKLNDWHLIRPLANYFHHKKVCGIKFQPCESHIDYDLKFMIDHNLSGMDWMVLKKARLLMVNEEKKVC
ncbi:MAG: DNA polymerase zeta catalytic subunit [Marteilia pararefringens]